MQFWGIHVFCTFEFSVVFLDVQRYVRLLYEVFALNHNWSEVQERRERLTGHLEKRRFDDAEKRRSPQRFFGQRSVRVGPFGICDWNASDGRPSGET